MDIYIYIYIFAQFLTFNTYYNMKKIILSSIAILAMTPLFANSISNESCEKEVLYAQAPQMWQKVANVTAYKIDGSQRSSATVYACRQNGWTYLKLVLANGTEITNVSQGEYYPRFSYNDGTSSQRNVFHYKAGDWYFNL